MIAKESLEIYRWLRDHLLGGQTRIDEVRMANINHSDSIKNSNPDQILNEILQDKFPDTLYRELRNFVREYPSHAMGHLFLGLYNHQYRFMPDELGLPVIVFGGSTIHPSRNTIIDRLGESEKHLNLAKSLDPNLCDIVGHYMAWVMLCRHRYGPAIIYIEDQLKKNDHKYACQLKLTLGIAYREMEEYDVALSLLRSLPGGDEMPSLHNHIAFTYLSKGDLENAHNELLVHLESSNDEKPQRLVEAIEAELQSDAYHAWMIYDELAQRCKYDPKYEFLGINSAKRAAKLRPGNDHDLDDYCDQLSY